MNELALKYGCNPNQKPSPASIWKMAPTCP